MTKRQIVTFRKDVVAGETNILDFQIPSDGTIEEVRIRFYSGVENALQVRPYLVHKGGDPEQIVRFADGTNQYITGDDDYFVFPVTFSVQALDTLKVWYDNTDPTYTYSLVVDFVMDYIGGTNTVR